MSSYAAVTTCNVEQWRAFGLKMHETFRQHWPAEVTLTLYAEGDIKDAWPVDHIVDLETAAPWLTKFKRRYAGAQYNGGSDGRDYRRAAVRFAHKIAALGAAAETTTADVLIWIDADVITHAPVTLDWLDSLFPRKATIAWLDRDRGIYPECGFVMYRMPRARAIIHDLVKTYESGAVFRLPEWHDSFVLQQVVNRAMRVDGMKVHSLSGPEGRAHIKHPMLASRIAECLDHLKGEIRKRAGRSLPSDLPRPRPEAYWR